MSRHLKIRRQQKARANAAVEYIVDNPSLTYAQVATMFGVSRNAIRRRIEYRYGSLTNARLHSDKILRTWERPCMACGCKQRRPYGQFRCDKCLDDANKLHDGIV